MAGNTLPQPEPGESLVSAESIFPLVPGAVVDGLANLEHSSNNMLALITDARGRYGTADQLYANMPFSDLIEWHVDNNDFNADGALLYRAGLLYGMDLGQQVAAQTDIVGLLKFSDARTFDAALSYLKDSYRGLTDEETRNWRRQKERELLYTGSDILSLANATLQDKVRARLAEFGMSVEPNALAQHVGIVDCVIFVDAYRSYSSGGRPKRFERPVKEFIPTFDPAIHERGSLIDLVACYEFESLSGLLQMTEGLDEMITLKRAGKSLAGGIYHGHQRMVQIGPNAFATAVELESIEAPRYSWRHIGRFALTGALVDTFYMFTSHDMPLKYVPLATMMNFGVGLAFEHGGRKALRRDAHRRDIPLNVSRAA